MKLTLSAFRRSARFNWKIGFGMTAYFLFLALVNMLFKSEWPFIILAWPMYVFAKHTGFAAIMEMIFVYFVAVFLVMLFDTSIDKKDGVEKEDNIEKNREKKEHSSETPSTKESSKDASTNTLEKKLTAKKNV